MRKPSFVFLYTLTVEPVLLPIFSYVGNTSSFADLHELAINMLGKGNTILYTLILINEYRKGHRTLKISPVVISFVLLIIYLALFHLGTSFELFVSDALRIISLTLAFLAISINNNILPSKKLFLNFLLSFLIYETIWCLLNINGLYIYKALYIDKTYYTTLTGEHISLVSGTFHRFSYMSDWISAIYLIICILYLCHRNITFVKFIIISVLSFIMVLMSGAKISIVLLIFTLEIACIANLKKNIHIFITINSIVLFLFFFMKEIIFLFDVHMLSGINRILEQFSVMIDNKGEEIGTLTISKKIINQYFENAPLLGNCRLHENINAYGRLTLLLKTDARLAFMLVEYGIVGLTIHLIFFYNLIRYIKIQSLLEQKNILIFFLFLVLASTTQSGFWDASVWTILSIGSYVLLKKEFAVQTYEKTNNNLPIQTKTE